MTPQFNNEILQDEHGNDKVFTTRFSAFLKALELRYKGYDVQLLQGDYFYRIELISEQPTQDEILGI